MKQVLRDRIVNKKDTPIHDEYFCFDILLPERKSDTGEIYFMSQMLEKYKNTDLLPFVKEKPAMRNEMYPAKAEKKIFTDLYNYATTKKKKIHIVGITLKEEIEILEHYYYSCGFFDESSNRFHVDFSQVHISACVHIENLMWKGSDYKAQSEKIFFIPPVRESGQNKALFKGINRGVVAGIYMQNFTPIHKEFLARVVREEKILPLTLGHILYYNLIDLGWSGKKVSFPMCYT